VTEAQFGVTLSFRVIRGPFTARLSIGLEEVSVVPARPPLVGRLRLFRPVCVPANDVECVHADRWYRRGLRFRTASGALDHIVIVPDDSRDRAAIHRCLQEYGYRFDSE
jgi:hypothetical protein